MTEASRHSRRILYSFHHFYTDISSEFPKNNVFWKPWRVLDRCAGKFPSAKQRRSRLLHLAKPKSAEGDIMSVKLIGTAPNLLKFSNSHSHDSWEILLHLDGSGKTIINDVEYDFYPGMIMCIPPHFSHMKISDNSFKDIFIQMDNFPAADRKHMLIFFDDEEKSIETLMYMALRIFHKKEKNYVSVVNSIIESIVHLLLSKISEKPKNESIELFKNEVIKNFTNPEFEIQTAIFLTNYCPDYFRRCFKNDTGKTPVSYLNSLRIEFAKNLLAKKHITKMNISEIALSSGFYDAHYFSRIFKKNVGITPIEYANNHSLYYPPQK